MKIKELKRMIDNLYEDVGLYPYYHVKGYLDCLRDNKIVDLDTFEDGVAYCEELNKEAFTRLQIGG